MTINIRVYEDSDYDMLASWWKGWKWQPVPVNYLPKIGAICSDSDIDVMAGFLIQTDIGASIIEWVISNPDYKNNRNECKKTLIQFLCDIAKGIGYNSVFVMTPSQHLIKTCQSMGFAGRDNLTSVVRAL